MSRANECRATQVVQRGIHSEHRGARAIVIEQWVAVARDLGPCPTMLDSWCRRAEIMWRPNF